jgi:hypothetical protein
MEAMVYSRYRGQERTNQLAVQQKLEELLKSDIA